MKENMPRNNSPKEEPDKNELSIGELREIQEKHSDEIKESERKKAEELERKGAAPKKMEKRFDVNEEIKQIQRQIEKIESGDFNKRIEDAEKIKGNILEKEAELKQTEAELNNIQERIEKIKEFTENQPSLADEVQKEIKATNNKFNEINRKINSLTKEINELHAFKVSKEEINKYQDLLKQIQGLNDELLEIEQDPYVVELMEKEINSKEQAINEVVSTALQKSGTGEGERKNIIMLEDNKTTYNTREEFIKKICIQFIKDEIELKGIDKIRDHSKRIDAIKFLCTNLKLGMLKENIEKIARDEYSNTDEKNIRLAGYALLSIIGKVGTGLGIIGNLEYEFLKYNDNWGYSTKGKKDELKALQSHYKTLNILTAYQLAYTPEKGSNKRDFSERVISNSTDFKPSRITDNHDNFIINQQGCITLKGLSTSEENKIKFDFDKNLKDAKKERELIEKSYENYIKFKTERLTEEKESLGEMMKKYKELERALTVNSKDILDKELSDTRIYHENIKKQFENKKNKRDNTKGILAYFIRNRQNSEIDILESEIIKSEENINNKTAEIEKLVNNRKEFNEIINTFGRYSDIENKVLLIEISLKQVGKDF